MARAYPQSDYADTAFDPGAGDWQALRGELVALLDQVESRFGAVSDGGGVSSRVRHLRDQVNTPDPASRRRSEALRSVKRAVDRFTPHEDEADDLNAAIAEIRSRQGAQTISAIDRRPSEMPEFRELSSLVSGMGDRLGRLEGQLRTARNSSSDVLEVASQVEQLTQVVELLAGAVGETGQVKRLETQIGALASMMSQAPKVDLSAVNSRLDDVSATVAKLAELQAQQMEREIIREERAEFAPKGNFEPAMASIEANVRSVYDRIDAIERNMSISGGDFERLTSEMAEVTQALRDSAANPELLASRVETLAQRLQSVDGSSDDVLALKDDIAALQQSVLKTMEPRFTRLESQLEALSSKVAPVDTSAVEGQLKALMTRMDEAGAQLDGLARLYHDAGDKPDFETLATLVAERTSDAMSRKAPAPVAMFGPESLKTIEDRISSLVRSVSKGAGADAETIASLVAEKTSAAFVKSGAPVPVLNPEGFDALEKRMTAVFNTAGKDTAERLARLEAALASRTSAPAPAAAPTRAEMPAPQSAKPQSHASEFDAAVEEPSTARLDSILSSLNGKKRADTMPSNPADEAPLVDRGFADVPQPRAAAPAPRPATPAPEPARSARPEVQPAFDPEKVERPPRPQSSFAQFDRDGFAAPARAETSAPAVEAPVSNTSTFVAAARRAQRARQEQVTEPASGNSLIGRALARVRPQPKAAAEEAAPTPAPEPKAEKRRPRKPVPEAPVAVAPSDEAEEARPNFLMRNRRTLLLAAAVVAVSMLTLNLVMQRMRSTPAPQPAAATSTETTPTTSPVDPTPAAEVSELVAPRVIDMVDATAVGSINPGERMSFTRATETPMPPTLLAQDTSGAADAAVETITDDATPPTGSIAASVAPEQFELPPEALGPEPLRQAAADGDAKAQFEIAAIYTEGRAIEASPEEAAKWYERSAAQGFVPAQYRLGNLYEAGTGVEKDLEMARLWYQRAAEAGNRMAMHNLAALYASGQLGEQQFEEAAQWFTQAATLGMVDSQFNLGMLYARGLGVEQDFEQSYKWFSLAAKAGDADAGKARDDIAKSLTADAVNRIGGEVETWTSEPIALNVNFAPIGTWAADFDPGEAISNKEVVSRVQQALNRLGFNVGTPDGVAGPKTAEAIRTFERGTGMSESGKINPRLLAVLGSQPV
ncbi:peptidoglycan-binding protein [Devosia sp.]|uniref:peptidoglycan-binding protein n=1 Tax=Devosia sp. TaxID=1871048 RepID=UPI001B0E187B|nr:peptidoglycan-binding protein [Devosia sp.]MBO9590668.1 SEL1-like repeat protein [Devosia sp.]